VSEATAPDESGGKVSCLPFKPGEKLTFKLKWGIIPAGFTVLEVFPIHSARRLLMYHFVMTTRTNEFVDLFYKVRDRIDAFTDADMTHTVLYKKRQIEGSTNRKVTVTFDWEKHQAQYTEDGHKRKPIEILPCSFDPLSIFYRTRLFDLKKLKEIEHPVTDGKKCVMGKATVVKREKIKIDSGVYDTYLLKPELEHVGGVFKKSEKAKIELWVTADERKIPVKIKSKVVVGSFVGELISAEKLVPEKQQETN
jgi:hypothetical protein